MSGLQKHLFVVQYEKGEFVTTPLQKEHLFQSIIQGSLSIYFIRDDGSVYSLANGQRGLQAYYPFVFFIRAIEGVAVHIMWGINCFD